MSLYRLMNDTKHENATKHKGMGHVCRFGFISILINTTKASEP